MFNYAELNEMLKEVLYLGRLDKFLRSIGKTIETAGKEDFYSFIMKEEQGKTDYYTGKPIPVNYTADMDKIQDLIFRYRKLKVIISSLMENEVL